MEQHIRTFGKSRSACARERKKPRPLPTSLPVYFLLLPVFLHRRPEQRNRGDSSDSVAYLLKITTTLDDVMSCSEQPIGERNRSTGESRDQMIFEDFRFVFVRDFGPMRCLVTAKLRPPSTTHSAYGTSMTRGKPSLYAASTARSD